MAKCLELPVSHICDPRHILSSHVVMKQGAELQRLAVTEGSKDCSVKGYKIYLAVLDIPEKHAKGVAQELGRHWGIFGSSCDAGAVVLYAPTKQKIAISSDPDLDALFMSHSLEGDVNQRHIGRLLSTPDEVAVSLIGRLHAALNRQRDVDKAFNFFDASHVTLALYIVGCFVGLSILALAVCCLYDAVAHWCHRARFLSCQTKLQRVHEVFLSQKGELPLCPYCVEAISVQPSPWKVVYLCGHRFHMCCANQWCREFPDKAGRCPICDGPQASTLEVKKGCECECTSATDSLDSTDEARSFILRSLHRQYPDIITTGCVSRWASCHTEIWLSELARPRYSSILRKHR